MSTQIASSRLICSSFEQAAGFYQELLSGITTYEELGARVLKHIRTAYSFCQVGQVRELSGILANSPVKEHRLIDRYYHVWCEFRESQCNELALETVIDQSRTYKSKALITRAGFEVYNGNSEIALYFYAEAQRL